MATDWLHRIEDLYNRPGRRGLLNVSRRTVERLIERRELGYIAIGTVKLVPDSVLRACIHAHAHGCRLADDAELASAPGADDADPDSVARAH